MRWIPRVLNEENEYNKKNNREIKEDRDTNEKGKNIQTKKSSLPEYKPLSLHYMWSPGR